MGSYQITHGYDIRLKGVAEKDVEALSLPEKVCIQPPDFRGIKPRVLVNVNDAVKVGAPLIEDKRDTRIKIVSPASGRIAAINRGDKRALLQIVVDTDGAQESRQFTTFPPEQLASLSRQQIVDHLLEGGVWPCLRQRPFSHFANPSDRPKAIFVQALNTEPLALDVDVVLKGREKEFQSGLDILNKLAGGKVHLCCHPEARSRALKHSKNVEIHHFSGPHPSGNVSTAVHYVDPIKKGDVVWYLRAEDVLRVAVLFLEGTFWPERFVAVTGECAQNRSYKHTVIGAPAAQLCGHALSDEMRVISGSILSGTEIGPQGYVGFYDSQLTVIPRGGQREFLGWIKPGFDKFSFSRTFASSWTRSAGGDVSLNADKQGGQRAIILNHIYDQYVPLNIMTFFLLRSVLAGDYEEAERHGILEVDEEDFALCTFACPSKTDVGGIIRRGLDVIEREG